MIWRLFSLYVLDFNLEDNVYSNGFIPMVVNRCCKTGRLERAKRTICRWNMIRRLAITRRNNRVIFI